jgi:(R,R)-butanediol dehydrogenase/meso-butanediol dehydrogenase/diacetyl reductase
VRAVRWHARDDVRLDDVPVPVPTAAQVLLRVEAAAICGTDVDEVRLGPITVPVEPHPVSGCSAPITLGHEIVGVVAEAGPASGLAVGQRVAPWPSQPCGRCRECTTGHANRCPETVALGMSADGGMADYVVVDGGRCVPVGADVTPERAVLVEPFAVALHGVHQVDLAARRVAVVGIGSLGRCVVEAAVRAGAGVVIAVSRSEATRAAAREAGATAAVPPEEAEAVDADVVFETAGAAPAVATSFAAVRRGGQIVILGGHPRPSEVDLLDVVVREVVVRGSVSHCFADFVAAAEGITAGDLARAPRRIEFAPLESGPTLLRTESATTKRILVPAWS